jgi:hypothetical protein
MNAQNQDYRLNVTITYDNKVIEDVLCEVYLPKRLIEPIELILKPTFQQSNLKDWPSEFSINGEIKDLSGETTILVQANKVYYKRGSTKYWSHEISESIISAKPFDLRITNFLRHDKGKEKDSTSGAYWITPSIMLKPEKLLTHSFTGEVTVKDIYNFEFTLINGMHLKFDHHYKQLNNDNGDMISFPVLVAEFETDVDSDTQSLLFENIDDLLMLTSFSARQYCACLGWEAYSSSEITKFYRRNITIPEIDKNHSFRDTLVDIKDFDEFISIAYNTFVNTQGKEFLRLAIYKSINEEKATIESNYLRLYSALESLVLMYRKNNDLEYIINDPLESDSFTKDIKRFIKSHSYWSNQENKGKTKQEIKDKRKLLYEKLPELNRISFSSAFNDFCKFHDIELSDLWPVVDRTNGACLSDIRNRIVHGDTFKSKEQEALILAGMHLRWIVERSILSLLKWPYAKSKASKRFLATHMTSYIEFNEARKILTSVVRSSGATEP